MSDLPPPPETILPKSTMPPPPSVGIGLALGSGIARGFAHIGVLKALNRYGIKPSIVAGTSMGAVVGGCYLANKLDELEDWALSLNRRRIFKYLDFKVRSPGLIGGKRLAAILDEHFGDMLIEDQKLPFVAIATDIVTGHEVWLRKGRFADNLRASFSLPGIFPPLALNGRVLIDGALVNPVPVSACQALGSQLTIAIDLNGDLIGKASRPGRNYQTVMGFDMNDPDVAPQAAEALGASPLTRRIFKRDGNNPSLFGVMVSSLNIIQDRLTRSRLAGDPPDVHIKPRIGHIGLLEFERAEELIKEGEVAVERKLPEIMSAIEILLMRTRPQDNA